MPTPIEPIFRKFIQDRLARYKKELPGRTSGTKQPLAASTITAREKGAEDFALFLLGEQPENERITGALDSSRTKPKSN